MKHDIQLDKATGTKVCLLCGLQNGALKKSKCHGKLDPARRNSVGLRNKRRKFLFFFGG